MKKKTWFLFIAVGILVSSFSAGFNAYAEDKPIKIGFIADFTGPLTEHGIAAVVDGEEWLYKPER